MHSGNGNGHGRQVAMVLVGYAANETFGHWWLGTLGRDMLPMRIGNWTVTPEMNVGFMIGWPIVLVRTRRRPQTRR